MRQPNECILEDPCQKALLEPYLRGATDELAHTRFASMLTPACQERLVRDFALHLASCAQDTLDTLVTRLLAQENWLWGLNAQLVPSKDLERVRDVVAKAIDNSRTDSIDEAAPLLRSVLQKQTERFVTTTKELMDRLWQDRHTIANELLDGGVSGELGAISNLDMRFGDCHDGGRRTTVVTCEAGRFVYKPRNSQIDLWFLHMARTYFFDAMRQPRVIERHDDSGYWGFAEFIVRTSVTDKAGIARYWHNFGRASALFQVLGSEDLHFENFVAAGELVSLIDSEAVITGEPMYLGDPRTSPNLGDASKGFGRDMLGTLATSALLPSLLLSEKNASPLIARGRSCLPVWDGREYDVIGYEDEFLRGFDEGLERLAARSGELRAELDTVSHIPVRRLIRDTDVYGYLLEQLCRREAYDPDRRVEMLAILHGPLIRGLANSRSPLANSETACLLEGDIPYFYAEAASRIVYGSDGTADPNYLATSAQERALERIGALDQTHRSFFHAVVEANLLRALVRSDGEVPPCASACEPLDETRALDEASESFRRLESLVVASPSGESSWLFRNEYYSLTKSSVEFGDGLGGVAVFLAALAPRVQDTQVSSHARSRLNDCLDRVEEVIACLEVTRVIPEISVTLGVSDGLGSVLRTLDLVVGALGDRQDMESVAIRAQSLRERFVAVLGRVDVEQARRTDVYSGVAGLLLALCSSPAARHCPGAADLARRLTNRLLEQCCCGKEQGLCDTLGKGWPVSGFGHGQAGIACALAMGSRAFGCDVGTAVRDALAFELEAYNERIGTWPDLRNKRASETYLHGLCSGAPGIGLAACTVKECMPSGYAPERELASELLERAELACARMGMQERDVLCCGNLSLVEFELLRGRRREAGCLLAGMVERKQALGTYVLQHAKWKQTDEPSLLWGLSGIGYLMLRYADPTLAGVFVS